MITQPPDIVLFLLIALDKRIGIDKTFIFYPVLFF